MINKKILLLLIVLLACFLRFWNIEQIPPSMYWDEVSQGYNSYSILQTGKDEHGEFFPIARFNAFGDYKAPVYIYLDAPFIALLGKTTLGVRFPSALFGTLTVLLTYFLVKEIFFSNKKKEILGLFSAFFLAISPWHIQLSRAAYEANIATFFTVTAVYLFFLAKRTKAWIFFPSVLFFVVAFYAFNAHRIFVPLLVIFLCILFFKELLVKEKMVILAGIMGIILLIPFLFYLRSPESKLRFNEVNIFSDIDVIKQSNKLISEDNNSPVAHIIHNRRVLFGLLYVKHYFDFFNPTYLFFSGDGNPRFSLRDNGQLFLWGLPLLLIGGYMLCTQKKKSTIVLLGWFLLAPVAAATARETPHALRSETFIPTYEIIAAFGAVQLLDFIQNFRAVIRRILIGIFTTIVVISLYIFLHNYFVHYPVFYSYEWQYGYKEAVKEAELHKKDYDVIAFTESYGRPYIYTLFYGDLQPEQYWKDSVVTRDIFGFYTVSKAGKYVFRKKLESPEDVGKKVLYVGREEEIPQDTKIFKKIYFLDGNVAFVIAGER